MQKSRALAPFGAGRLSKGTLNNHQTTRQTATRQLGTTTRQLSKTTRQTNRTDNQANNHQTTKQATT